MNIETLLNSYAFPVIACVFLVLLLKKLWEQTNEEEKEHRKEIKSLSNTIEKNTLAIEKLGKVIEYNFEKILKKGGEDNGKIK